MLIRPAAATDARPMARVHVQNWRETYRTIIPDSVLAGLCEEERAAMWSKALATGAGSGLHVVIDADAQLVGFAHGGPALNPTRSRGHRAPATFGREKCCEQRQR